MNAEALPSEAKAPSVDRARRGSKLRPLIVLVGNPNVGKSTLFNQLTGERARIGNYPGVTVERRAGVTRLPGGALSISASRGSGSEAQSTGAPPDEYAVVETVDVPGAYSLSARSAEEQIAILAMLGLGEHPAPDLVVAVVDAGQLIRNLYLVLQLVELRVPLVIALNMIDEVKDCPPDPVAVAKLFGVPCVATDGRRGIGIETLKATLRNALERPQADSVSLNYPEALEGDVERVREALPPELRYEPTREHALALWALTSISDDDELEHIPAKLRQRCLEVQREAAAKGRDIDEEIIFSRYAFLDRHHPELCQRAPRHPGKPPVTERIDRVLLHPVYGFGLFIGVMFVVFQALFTWSDPAIGLIEQAIGWLKSGVVSTLPDGFFRDLLTEGILGGVGNVIVFLPQILLLFFFIGLLEDSGYMARVAFLMDRIMRSVGLHGRAFVPMLSGFACAVPAILATRTMERRRDRLLTMLVIPLMTCSARLPVYTLIIAALFPPTDVFGWMPVQGLLMTAMYLFSTTIALAAAGVLGRTVVRGRRIPLILELPPYRLPEIRVTAKMMLERSGVFLKEAGTVILVCTILLWGLLSFPKVDNTSAGVAAPAPASAEITGTEVQEPAIARSYGGRLGKALEPAIEPLGFDWKIGIGIIGAFAAREVFVSTMGLVYGIGEADENDASLREQIRNEQRHGVASYRPLTGLSLMVFFALACQCMSTLAVVRRETRTWRWPAFMLVYMTGLAYAASFLVFQGGSRLGF